MHMRINPKSVMKRYIVLVSLLTLVILHVNSSGASGEQRVTATKEGHESGSVVVTLVAGETVNVIDIILPIIATPTRGESVFVKVNIDGDELWRFKWLGQHHTNGDADKGGQIGLSNHCGLWLVEEDGFGGDDEGWTVVEPGSIIKSNAGSLNEFITIANSHCEEDLCEILSYGFGPVNDYCENNDNCILSESRTEYKPKRDIICAVDDGLGKWYLCDVNNFEFNIGGIRYFCRVSDGGGSWQPREDCDTPEDENDNGRINCGDEDCYGTDRSRINTPEPIDSHPISGGRAYYHPNCDPDSNSLVCLKGISTPYSEFFNSRHVYGWDETNKCCGDDDEAGVVANDKLCYINTEKDAFGQWLPSADYAGKIFATNELLYLSSNNDWWYCDGASFKKDGSSVPDLFVNGRHFICTGTAGIAIKVCCGASEGNCNVGEDISSEDKLIIGEYFTKGSRNYYCTEPEPLIIDDNPNPNKGIFLIELDATPTENHRDRYTEAKKACNGLKNSNGNKIANWTGTKCCGEPSPDDLEEYYNNPPTEHSMGVGGCWNTKGYLTPASTPTLLVEELPAQVTREGLKAIGSEVAINNGTFYGCQALDSTIEQSDNVISENKLYCSKDNANKYLCSYKNKWWSLDKLDSSGYTLTIRPDRDIGDAPAIKEYSHKSLPDGITPDISIGEYQTQCCPRDECWDGSKCVLFGSQIDKSGSFTTQLWGSSYWTGTVTSFNPALVNDGELNYAWHTDSAGVGNYIQIDLGTGNEREFVKVRIQAVGTYTAIWDVQYSDDAVSWATAYSGWNSGAAADSSIEWSSVGRHRYWRLYKTNSAVPGSWQQELQFYERPEHLLLNCIKGEDGVSDWARFYNKTSLGGEEGYCFSDEQCLVAIPNSCIDNGEFYLTEEETDNFCHNGDWTSRTRLIAGQLVSIAGSNFVLYCTAPDSALNNNYGIKEIISNFDDLTINNICILKQEDSVTLGLTLNKDMDESLDKAVENAFGIDCSVSGEIFQDCGEGKLWHNPRIKGLIYNKHGVTLEGKTVLELADVSKSLISDAEPMRQVSEKISERFQFNPNRFNSIYIAKIGDKSIYGLFEGDNIDSSILGVRYETPDDICNLIASDRLSCQSNENLHFVTGQGNPAMDFIDLTAKLRP